MLCSKCGAEYPADARFCGKCGTPLNALPAMPAPGPGNAAAQASARRKWRLTFSITFGAIAGLAVLGGLFMIGSRLGNAPYPKTLPTQPTPPDANDVGSDAYYRNKVVGTWQVRKFVMGSYVDVRCAYMYGGRASWTGTLTYMGQQTFLHYSGTWQVENGLFHTRIESSNVPQLIPAGMTGASRFVSIDEEQWTFVDISDGQTGTAVRVGVSRE